MEYLQSLYELVYDYMNPEIPTLKLPHVEVSEDEINNFIGDVKKEMLMETLQERHFQIKYQDLQERLNNLEDDHDEQDDPDNNNFEKIPVRTALVL